MVWNLSGATYNNASPILYSQNRSGFSIHFNTDKTKMYSFDYYTKSVFQYSLSTPGDVSTATYDSIYFSLTNETTSPHNIHFSPDSSKMYVAGAEYDGQLYQKVYQYSLSTPGDLSTISYTGDSFDISSVCYSPASLFFKSDGTKLYIGNEYNGSIYKGEIFQFSLSTAWDITSTSYDSKSLDVSAKGDYIYGIWLEPDGYTMYASEAGSKLINQYTLSTAWDVSTGTYTSNLDVSAYATSNTGIFFNSDGTDLYVLDAGTDKVYNYELPWNGIIFSPEASMSISATTPSVNIIISSPTADMEITAEDPSIFIGLYLVSPEAIMEIVGDTPKINFSLVSPEAIMEIVGDTPKINFSLVSPEAIMLITSSDPASSTFSLVNSVIRYLLTVTGTADSTTDIELPLKSFQARRKGGEPTYLSVVIPTLDFADEITARSNGTIKVEQAYEVDGELVQRELILEAEIDNIKPYEGGRNQSVVLDGYKTTSYTPKAITLSTATYRTMLRGKIRYRLAKPDVFLNPGDTVTIGLDTFVLGAMSYAISNKMEQIELEEA